MVHARGGKASAKLMCCLLLVACCLQLAACSLEGRALRCELYIGNMGNIGNIGDGLSER